MADHADDDEFDHTEDDDRKVFVSQLPPHWESDELTRVFSAAFGPVTEAFVKWVDLTEDGEEGGDGEGTDGDGDDRPKRFSKRFGFVVFESADTKALALAKGSLKRQQHKVRIRDVDRGDRDGRGRDRGVCHLWTRGICPHREACRFLHPVGEGSCAPPPGSKKKKCYLFKKGKCKLGDACKFVHVASAVAETSPRAGGAGDGAGACPRAGAPRPPKPCLTWKKRGKCSKGDACRFAHDAAVAEKAKRKKAERAKRHAAGLGGGADGAAAGSASKKRKRGPGDGGGGGGGGSGGGAAEACDFVRVFGFPYETTEDALRAYFAGAGAIARVDMPRYPDSGRSKGFCSITFEDAASVAKAITLGGEDGEKMGGRWLRVEEGNKNAPAQRRRDGVCFAFQRGACSRGGRCKFQHVTRTRAAGTGSRRRETHTAGRWPHT